MSDVIWLGVHPANVYPVTVPGFWNETSVPSRYVAGFGFVAYSFRDGESYGKEPEYFWLANASEIKELWYDQGLGELLEAGVGFGTSRNVDCRYDDSDVGDLQFILRGRDGREILTTVRRCLDEYDRTGDWYFDAIVSSEPVGKDVCEIFKKYNAHNLPE